MLKSTFTFISNHLNSPTTAHGTKRTAGAAQVRNRQEPHAVEEHQQQQHQQHERPLTWSRVVQLCTLIINSLFCWFQHLKCVDIIVKWISFGFGPSVRQNRITDYVSRGGVHYFQVKALPSPKFNWIKLWPLNALTSAGKSNGNLANRRRNLIVAKSGCKEEWWVYLCVTDSCITHTLITLAWRFTVFSNCTLWSLDSNWIIKLIFMMLELLFGLKLHKNTEHSEILWLYRIVMTNMIANSGLFTHPEDTKHLYIFLEWHLCSSNKC